MKNKGPRRLREGEVRFLMIDVQEKLLPSIEGLGEVLANSCRLLAAARLLDIPTYYTEQYPKGIGPTEASVAAALPEGAARFEKTHFSCFDEPGFEDFFRLGGDDTVTVAWGTEAHICLMTTVMDMLDRGMRTAVVCDASGSRKSANAAASMETMRAAGALVLPTESVVYQLLARSGTDRFKAMLPFFK